MTFGAPNLALLFSVLYSGAYSMHGVLYNTALVEVPLHTVDVIVKCVWYYKSRNSFPNCSINLTLK